MNGIANPMYDIVFKRIFGNPETPDITMGFLNSIWDYKGKDRIIELKFMDPINNPIWSDDRLSIFDIKVKDGHGHIYVIEMQNDTKVAAEIQVKRFLYYACKNYSGQLNDTNKYTDLNYVRTVVVTNHTIAKVKDPVSVHSIRDDKTSLCCIEDFKFCFVQLNKFKKTIDELVTDADYWMYFLKHAREDDYINYFGSRIKTESDAELQHAHDELVKFSYSKEERANYEYYRKHELDYNSEIYNAIERGKEIGEAKGKAEGLAEGVEKGKAEGLAEGVEKGKVEGLAEGKAEGAKAEKINIARELLEESMSIDKIIKITGLTKEEIEKL
jgi:predicted transposase/invertase (TIGR01784 family)